MIRHRPVKDHTPAAFAACLRVRTSLFWRRLRQEGAAANFKESVPMTRQLIFRAAAVLLTPLLLALATAALSRP